MNADGALPDLPRDPFAMLDTMAVTKPLPVTSPSTKEEPLVRGYAHRDRHHGADRVRGRHGRRPASAQTDPGPRSSSVDLPTVTVLIPAHQEAETIATTVRACAEQDYPITEIIVVADSCTDNTAAVARAAGATVIETSYGDKAANQNEALQCITTDVVVGFDGDTIPEPGCIRLMLDDIRNGFDATCSTILPLQPRGFFVRGRRFAYALGRRWWRLCQASVGRMQVLTGASYAFKTDVIKAIGGFPNGLISADMDATWALHKAGYKCGYAAKAVALTVEPETWKVYRGQMRRWSSGYFQNLARYKRQVFNWRSALVIWTAMFDLVSLFAYEAGLIWSLATRHFWMARTFGIGLGIHAVVTIALVASVVGPAEALKGYLPYMILNYYNKWLYVCALCREWILGRHYAAWTGRQARKTEITRMTRARKITLSCIAILALAATGCTVAVQRHRPTAPVTAPAVQFQSGRVAPSVVGVVAEKLAPFDQRCGCHPDVAVHYVHWGESATHAAEIARGMLAEHATPLLELSPFNVTLADIINGQQDAYLRSYARMIHDLGAPVLMSFAPEANGYWWPWGWPQTKPATEVAAWRHVVDIFRSEGAVNARWLWIINQVWARSGPLAQLWPGAAYVDEVGIDGYFKTAQDSFASEFAPTLSVIRGLTGKAALISETGASPQAGKARVVAALMAGVRQYGLAGFIWFDIDQGTTGLGKNNWAIDNDPAALAAFSQATKR